MAEIAPRIRVIAGTNGGGKSSIAGVLIRQGGGEYFNPDEAARKIRETNPAISQAEANSSAWYEGKRLLERAIAQRKNFTFETTLGGNTFPALLQVAIAKGFDVRVWYVGLATPELHLARVRARVAKGGHDIPEADIRKRFDAGRRHLIELMPGLRELHVYDNSADVDPATGRAPEPTLVLHLEHGRIMNLADLPRTPDWAKPIVAAAMRKELTPGA